MAHDWSKGQTRGQWLLEQRRERCVVVRRSDPGGGLHLLPNGVVIIGRRQAMMHLQTDVGPVGPQIVSFEQAVRPFVDRIGVDAATMLKVSSRSMHAAIAGLVVLTTRIDELGMAVCLGADR